MVVIRLKWENINLSQKAATFVLWVYVDKSVRFKKVKRMFSSLHSVFLIKEKEEDTKENQLVWLGK